MVRMVAITASFEMSYQVGATAVRTRSAARANSSASRIQVAKRSQISRPSLPPGGAPDDRRHHPPNGLDGAKGHDEHRPRLDDERDVARDLIELLFERYGFPRRGM